MFRLRCVPIWVGQSESSLLESAAFGEVAERFKAAVLKTVEAQASGGSNPSLSAILQMRTQD